MRTILSYPTSKGTFDLGQSTDKKYHIIFDEESLGSYNSIQEAVDNLVENKTSAIFNTSNLGIPQDYTQWDTAY